MRHLKLGVAMATVATAATLALGATVLSGEQAKDTSATNRSAVSSTGGTVDVQPAAVVQGLAANGDPDSHPRAVTRHGCPAGAVCVYPRNKGWNGDRPSLVFFSFGAHNLSNQFGVHRVLNNQTGNAIARTCTARNGGGCLGALHAGRFINPNLTPIDSILLARR